MWGNKYWPGFCRYFCIAGYIFSLWVSYVQTEGVNNWSWDFSDIIRLYETSEIVFGDSHRLPRLQRLFETFSDFFSKQRLRFLRHLRLRLRVWLKKSPKTPQNIFEVREVCESLAKSETYLIKSDKVREISRSVVHPLNDTANGWYFKLKRNTETYSRTARFVISNSLWWKFPHHAQPKVSKLTVAVTRMLMHILIEFNYIAPNCHFRADTSTGKPSLRPKIPLIGRPSHYST